MDIARFEAIARSLRTRDELEQLVANAKAAGRVQFIALGEQVLAERFPNQSKSRSGPNPTIATCLGKVGHFDTGKDAYVWLIQRFREHRPGLLEIRPMLRRWFPQGTT